MPLSHDQDVYLRVEQVAAILKVSPRQASRYGAKMRTQRAGRRVLYHRDDVQKLADELGADYRLPPPTRTEMLAPGDFLNALRESQSEALRLSREKGQLEGSLQMLHRQLTENTESLSARLAAAEQERDAAKAELERLKHRRWWRRLLDI